MAGLFDIEEDGQSFGYELPVDTFTRPGSSYLDLGGFTYTPDEAPNSIMPTSDELEFSNLNLGGFDYVPEATNPIMPTSAEANPLGIPAEWKDRLDSIAKTLGLTKEGGGYDWGKIIGMGAAGLTLNDTLNQSAQPVKTTHQLLEGMPSNTPAGFSPGALSAMARPLQAGNQLQRQYAADMPSSIRDGGRGYAEGGNVEMPGALSQTFDSARTQGYVDEGEGGGQDDMIAARLSPGEYIFDAESVSMLGDGDNAAGARKLDELREVMRAHKRSAPADEIAPKSLGPLSYMNGGLNA